MTPWMPFVGLALLGAVHCAGMCGPLIMLLGSGGKSGLLGGQLAFVMGKALTYAILASLLSSLSMGATREVEQLDQVRSVFAWVSGGLLVLHGLTCMGLPSRLGRLGVVFTMPGRWLRQSFAHLRALPGYAGPLGAGMVAGSMPCGLSWSAILLAAAMPPAQASAALLLFGACTGPALLGVGLSWRRFSQRWRRVATAGLGPALVVFGLWTATRGGLPLGWGEAVLPECCQEG